MKCLSLKTLTLVCCLAPVFPAASLADDAPAADPADAVRAARSTALPSWKDLSSKESEVLTGFGGGDTSGKPRCYPYSMQHG